MDENHCRACCEELSDFQEPLFDREDGEDIKNKFQFVTGIKIQSCDQLSKALCTRCFDDTITAYDLKTRSLETEKRLVNYEVLDIFTNEKQTDVVIIKTEPDFEDLVIKTEMIDVNELIEYSVVDQVEKPKRKTLKKVNTKANKNSFKCNDCGYSTKTLEGLECHLRTAHVKGFQCQSCKKCFPTIKSLEAHLKMDAKHEHELAKVEQRKLSNSIQQELVSCESCGKILKRRNLWQHRNRFHNAIELNFECDICGKTYKQKKNILSHVILHIPTRFRLFECDICGGRYSNMTILKTHLKFHSRVKPPLTDPIPCDYCGKILTNETCVRQHVNYVHKKEQFQMKCKQCGKVLWNKYALKNHIKIMHTPGGQGNFMCNICGKRFNLVKEINSHTKVVHSKENFLCDFPGCDKKFKTKTYVKSHMKNVHMNLKNYSCPYANCGKFYTSKQKLNNHIRLTHEKFKVNCPVGNGCKFAVGRRDYMRHHLARHKELSQEDLATYEASFKKMKLI